MLVVMVEVQVDLMEKQELVVVELELRVLQDVDLQQVRVELV